MKASSDGGTRQVIASVAFDLMDYREVLDTIEIWRSRGDRRYVTLANPHCVMLCHHDEQMKRATRDADLTLTDGVGIVLAARLLGLPDKGRVTGPDLMLKLCDRGRQLGYRHYLYGGKPGVADLLAERLQEAYPGIEIVGTESPPFRPLSEDEDVAVVTRINRSRPDVVWVGLEAPKQEKWMASHRGRIEVPVMIGVGAAFDFHSGTVRRAPDFIRKLGLEWTYRLAMEPRRMWRRNLDSPRFMLRVLRQRFFSLDPGRR